MSKSGLDKKLGEIRTLHSQLEKEIEEHETLFEDGYNLIERLQHPPEEGYDKKTKDAILTYIDKIFNELYHIEVGGDEDFKKAFQAVITDDVDRFERQNDYLQQWIDFAVASNTIEGEIERALRSGIAELVALQKDAASGGNPGRIFQKSKGTYDNLFKLREQLKGYSYERYHEHGQRRSTTDIPISWSKPPSDH